MLTQNLRLQKRYSRQRPRTRRGRGATEHKTGHITGRFIKIVRHKQCECSIQHVVPCRSTTEKCGLTLCSISVEEAGNI